MPITDVSIGLDRFDLREILLRGSNVWNQWRQENPEVPIDLIGADLRNADLRNADLRNADLRNADLRNADLRNADLNSAYLYEANFSRANLSSTDLNSTYLVRAILKYVNLSGAKLIEAKLISANLINADLEEADLARANLGGAKLIEAKLISANLINADLRDADLINADLARANLGGANLRDADLINADLRGANLINADLRGANLINAKLISAKLGDANLSSANLEGTKLPVLIKERLFLRQIIQKITPTRKKETTPTRKEETTPTRKEETIVSIKVFDQVIDPSDLAQLKTAIANYAEAAGYEDPEILSEERGSFFSKIRYRIAKILSPDVIEEATREGEESASPKYDLRGAQFAGSFGETVLGSQGGGTVSNNAPLDSSTQNLANATAELLKAVENFDNIILTLGKIILVKYTAPDGKTKTVVRTVSTEIQNKLESTPHILDDPQKLLAFLQAENTVTQDLPLPVIPEERQVG